MKRLVITFICLFSVALISGCADNSSDTAKTNYQELDWEELKPAEQLASEENAAIESLTAGDEWFTDDFNQGGLQGGYAAAPIQSYSSGIVSELDQKSVRIPGFVVPVEFGDDNSVTEFFLVPYFGACFHKPPPPPNQTLYVTSAEPIKYESIYDPVWVMGTIETKQIGNEIATAAYSMKLEELEPYSE